MIDNLMKIDINNDKFDNLSRERYAEICVLLSKKLTTYELQEIHTELFNRHVRLLFKIVRNYSRTDVEYEDLVAAGALALWKSVTTWKPKSGPIMPWAIRFIKTGLNREVDANRQIKIPEDVSYKRAIIYRLKTNDGMSDEDIATKLEITVEDIKTIEMYPVALNILNEPDENNNTMESRLSNQEKSIEDIVIQNDTIQIIYEALALLSEVEKQVMLCRWGLQGDIMSFQQISNNYNLGRETIRRIESGAVSKLRHPSFPINLKSYLNSYQID